MLARIVKTTKRNTNKKWEYKYKSNTSSMHTYTASQGAIWSSGRPSKQQSCRSGNLCDDDDLILKLQKNEQIKFGVDNNQCKHYIVA